MSLIRSSGDQPRVVRFLIRIIGLSAVAVFVVVDYREWIFLLEEIQVR